MKKIIVWLMIFMMLFNFSAPTIYATTNTDEEDTRPTTGSNDLLNTLEDTGQPQGTKKIGNSVTVTAGVIGFIVGFLNTLPMVIQWIFSSIARAGLIEETTTVEEPETKGTYHKDLDVSPEEIENCKYFTVEDIVFNKIPILSVDFFDLKIDPIENEKDDATSIRQTFLKSASIWFNFSRLLALGLSLPILIVIIMKMAMSTVASDKAKYKEMLFHWLASLLILFLLQYIMTIISALSYLLLNIIKGVAENVGSFSFEKYMIIKARKQIGTYSGFQIVGILIVYWLLVYYQIKFFFMYVKRMFAITLLMIIAPLITVTYPIDKAGDGKAQAYEKWLGEYIVNIFIQPIHALVYTVFMFTAGSICVQAPLLAVLFLMSLSRGEKIIKNLFNMRGKASINSLQLLPKKN